jgi:hypothetical protein
MIVVKVELHSAKTGEVTRLNTVIISNDGKDADCGKKQFNYRTRSFRKGATPEAVPGAVMIDGQLRSGKIKKHSRESAPVLNLVLKALKAMKY